MHNLLDALRSRGAAVVLSLTAALTVAIGCSRTTQPPDPATAFPTFSLIDVNPNTLTSGFALTQSRLAGPAAVVYFGWAT